MARRPIFLQDPRFRIAGLYLIFGIAWILFSDRLLEMAAYDAGQLTRLQTYKGWGFVAVTAMLLFILVGQYRRQDLTRLATLRESESLHRTVLDNAADAVFIADASGHFVYTNQQASVLLGYDRNTLLGMSVDGVVPNRENERALSLFAQLRARGRQLENVTLQHRDGTEIPVELNAVILPNGHFFAACRDISERLRADAHARQAAAVFDSSRDAIIISDPQGIITAVNPAFSHISGYSEREILGSKGIRLRSLQQPNPDTRQIVSAIRRDGGWSGEIACRHKNGGSFPAWLSISTVDDASGSTNRYAAILSDLTRIKRSEADLEHLSTHDPLTDLPNGRLLESRLEHAISQAKRHKTGLALLMLDIDRFKDINDSLGLNAGDTLLKELARRVSDTLWEGDTVARIGGDELLVLIEDIRSPQQATMVAEKIRRVQSAPFTISEQELFLTISLGISLFPENGDTPELLMRNADAAVYRAKAEGRNRIAFYSDSLTRDATERLSLEAELRRALEQQQFELHFQPQIDLSSKRMSGVEALIRWRHPQRGLIPPDSFIPVAESIGLIEPIGEWVLEEGCRQMRAWLDAGVNVPRISINLSAKQLGRDDLVSAVKNTLDKYRLSPKSIELELTETAIMQDPEKAAETLRAMARLGIEMAVDDFGTGYSSLAYLQRLSMHRLKIDRTFVNGLPDDKNNAAICRAVIALANSLGMETIAEGVEKLEQIEYLELESCNIAQGWHFARAMPAADLVGWMQARDR